MKQTNKKSLVVLDTTCLSLINTSKIIGGNKNDKIIDDLSGIIQDDVIL